jgi:hypothetical protein
MRLQASSRFAVVNLVLPVLVIITAVSMSNLPAMCGGIFAFRVAFSGCISVAVFFAIGRCGMKIASSVTPQRKSFRAERMMKVFTCVATWTIVFLIIVVFPTLPNAKLNRAHQFRDRPEEHLAIAALHRIGGELEYDPWGYVGVVELWDVSDNDVVSLSELKHVRRLHLYGPRISDQAILAFLHLKELTRLDLSGTGVTSECFPRLSQLSALKYLDLSDTEVSDNGIDHLSELTDLRELRLNGTQVTDTGLESLIDLPRIRSISVDGTRVTEGGIDRFLKSRPDCEIHFFSGQRKSDK